MAKLAQIIAVTHNPILVRTLRGATLSPAMARGKQLWGEMRDKLAASRPDVLIIAANAICFARIPRSTSKGAT